MWKPENQLLQRYNIKTTSFKNILTASGSAVIIFSQTESVSSIAIFWAMTRNAHTYIAPGCAIITQEKSNLYQWVSSIPQKPTILIQVTDSNTAF